MKPPDNKYAIQSLFTVSHFMGINGNKVNKMKDATIVIAIRDDSLCLPFAIDIAKRLKLRKGSKFIEQIEYVKV